MVVSLDGTGCECHPINGPIPPAPAPAPAPPDVCKCCEEVLEVDWVPPGSSGYHLYIPIDQLIEDKHRTVIIKSAPDSAQFPQEHLGPNCFLRVPGPTGCKRTIRISMPFTGTDTSGLTKLYRITVRLALTDAKFAGVINTINSRRWTPGDQNLFDGSEWQQFNVQTFGTHNEFRCCAFDSSTNVENNFDMGVNSAYFHCNSFEMLLTYTDDPTKVFITFEGRGDSFATLIQPGKLFIMSYFNKAPSAFS